MPKNRNRGRDSTPASNRPQDPKHHPSKSARQSLDLDRSPQKSSTRSENTHRKSKSHTPSVSTDPIAASTESHTQHPGQAAGPSASAHSTPSRAAFSYSQVAAGITKPPPSLKATGSVAPPKSSQQHHKSLPTGGAVDETPREPPPTDEDASEATLPSPSSHHPKDGDDEDSEVVGARGPPQIDQESTAVSAPPQASQQPEEPAPGDKDANEVAPQESSRIIQDTLGANLPPEPSLQTDDFLPENADDVTPRGSPQIGQSASEADHPPQSSLEPDDTASEEDNDVTPRASPQLDEGEKTPRATPARPLLDPTQRPLGMDFWQTFNVNNSGPSIPRQGPVDIDEHIADPTGSQLSELDRCFTGPTHGETSDFDDDHSASFPIEASAPNPHTSAPSHGQAFGDNERASGTTPGDHRARTFDSSPQGFRDTDLAGSSRREENHAQENSPLAQTSEAVEHGPNSAAQESAPAFEGALKDAESSSHESKAASSKQDSILDFHVQEFLKQHYASQNPANVQRKKPEPQEEWSRAEPSGISGAVPGSSRHSQNIPFYSDRFPQTPAPPRPFLNGPSSADPSQHHDNGSEVWEPPGTLGLDEQFASRVRRDESQRRYSAQIPSGFSGPEHSQAQTALRPEDFPPLRPEDFPPLRPDAASGHPSVESTGQAPVDARFTLPPEQGNDANDHRPRGGRRVQERNFTRRQRENSQETNQYSASFQYDTGFTSQTRPLQGSGSVSRHPWDGFARPPQSSSLGEEHHSTPHPMASQFGGNGFGPVASLPSAHTQAAHPSQPFHPLPNVMPSAPYQNQQIQPQQLPPPPPGLQATGPDQPSMLQPLFNFPPPQQNQQNQPQHLPPPPPAPPGLPDQPLLPQHLVPGNDQMMQNPQYLGNNVTVHSQPPGHPVPRARVDGEVHKRRVEMIRRALIRLFLISQERDIPPISADQLRMSVQQAWRHGLLYRLHTHDWLRTAQDMRLKDFLDDYCGPWFSALDLRLALTGLQFDGGLNEEVRQFVLNNFERITGLTFEAALGTERMGPEDDRLYVGYVPSEHDLELAQRAVNEQH